VREVGRLSGREGDSARVREGCEEIGEVVDQRYAEAVLESKREGE